MKKKNPQQILDTYIFVILREQKDWLLNLFTFDDIVGVKLTGEFSVRRFIFLLNIIKR